MSLKANPIKCSDKMKLYVNIASYARKICAEREGLKSKGAEGGFHKTISNNFNSVALMIFPF